LGEATRGIAPLAASPDGKVLVSGNSQGQLLWVSSGPRVPALRVGPAVPASGEPRGRARGVTAVAFAPDGRQVAVGLADGTTVLQPVDGSSETRRARDWGPGYPVLALAFSPDGATLVSAHYDGSVVLRDGKTAARRGEPANIVNDSSDGIEALSFSADGRRLLVHTYRRGVVVCEMAALASLDFHGPEFA
jgi:WD40 repeat protein